jgi:hypothetical protein
LSGLTLDTAYTSILIFGYRELPGVALSFDLTLSFSKKKAVSARRADE